MNRLPHVGDLHGRHTWSAMAEPRPDRPLRARPNPLRPSPDDAARRQLLRERHDQAQSLRQPAGLAMAGVGLPACAWLALVGVGRAFEGVFASDEAAQRTSSEGQGFVFLALMGAFVLTLMVQVVAIGRVNWGRAWCAWAFVLMATVAAFTASDLIEVAGDGYVFLPIAAFLAIIVPPRDVRWTAAALLAGVFLFAVLAPHGWWAAIVLAPLPLVGAEITLVRPRSTSTAL
jgi:hypothetical protein